jgi:hypothetical protein
VATQKMKKTKTSKVKVEETEEGEVGDGLDEQEDSGLPALQEQTDGEVELEREINFSRTPASGLRCFVWSETEHSSPDV